MNLHLSGGDQPASSQGAALVELSLIALLLLGLSAGLCDIGVMIYRYGLMNYAVMSAARETAATSCLALAGESRYDRAVSNVRDKIQSLLGGGTVVDPRVAIGSCSAPPRLCKLSIEAAISNQSFFAVLIPRISTLRVKREAVIEEQEPCP